MSSGNNYRVGDYFLAEGHFFFLVPKGTRIEISDPSNENPQNLTVILQEDLVGTTAGYTKLCAPIIYVSSNNENKEGD